MNGNCEVCEVVEEFRTIDMNCGFVESHLSDCMSTYVDQFQTKYNEEAYLIFFCHYNGSAHVKFDFEKDLMLPIQRYLKCTGCIQRAKNFQMLSGVKIWQIISKFVQVNG